jgi:hypothetical protein
MGGFVGPDPSNSEASGQQFATNLPSAGDIPVANADGTFTWTPQGSLTASKINGVTVSSTAPTTGQVLTATSATTADWATT